VNGLWAYVPPVIFDSDHPKVLHRLAL